MMLQIRDRATHNAEVSLAVSQPIALQVSDQYLRGLLVPVSTSIHFSTLDIVSADHAIIVQGEAVGSRSPFSSAEEELIDQTLRGQTVSLLQKMILPAVGSGSQNQQWVLEIAIPIGRISTVDAHEVLLATQPIDTYFAEALTQQAGVNEILCLAG